MASSRKPHPARDAPQGSAKKPSAKSSGSRHPAVGEPKRNSGSRNPVNGKLAAALISDKPDETRTAGANGAGPGVGSLIGVITCTKGPDTDGTLPVEMDRQYSIGRGRDNDLVLKDIAASRHHVSLVCTARQVRVVDAGSGNGTRVNGKKCKDAVLQDGDLIEIGSSILLFTVSARVKTAPAARAPRKEGPWMDQRTIGGSEAEQLRREFLEESLSVESQPPRYDRTNTRAAGAIVEDTQRRAGRLASAPPDVRGLGTTSVGLSRSTLIVILLIAVGVLLLALSIAIALLATRTRVPEAIKPPAAAAPAQGHAVARMMTNAIDLEKAGESARADGVLDGLKLVATPDEHKAARQRVQAIREQNLRKSKEGERAAEQQRAEEQQAAEQKRADEEKKAAEQKRLDDENKAAEHKRVEESKQAAARKQREAEERRRVERRDAERRRAAQRKPAPKPAVRKMSDDDARAAFSRASRLRRDGSIAEAIKVLEDIVARAEPGDGRKRAETALPRYRKALEDSQ